MRIRRSGLAGCALLLSSFWALSASAQEPAPAPPAPPPPPPAPAAPAPAAAPAVAPAAPRDEAPADETSDHDKLAGHLGVGYFGISQIPYAAGLGGAGVAGTANVTAPVVGVRYWLNPKLGIDVGAGLSLSTFSVSQTPAPNPAPQNPPTVFAFALHGGVPIALASAKHFTFEIVPEATFGYATTSINQNTPAPNISLHGLRLDIGGRVGGEINFGFMGLPQLALEASVGLYARYQNVGGSQDGFTPAGGMPQAARSGSSGAFTLGTSVGSDPWAIFTDNISALYYF